MKIIKWLMLSLSVSYLYACGGGSDGNSNAYPKIQYLDISDAKSLFIARQNSVSTSSADPQQHAVDSENRLFKITDDGYVLEVTIDDNTHTEQPVYINNVNEDLVIIGFGSDDANPSDAYVVNKTTGQAYSLDAAGLPVPTINNFINMNGFQSDALGNVYYAINSWTSSDLKRDLVKLSTANDTSLHAEVISPIDEHIEYFTVDDAGNIAYIGSHINDVNGYTSIRRIITQTGSFYNLPPDVYSFWRNSNGLIHLETEGTINQVDITGDSVSLSNYASAGVGLPYSSHLLAMNGYTYVIETHFNTGEIYEIFNPSNTPRLFEIGMSNNQSAARSGSYFYVEGLDNLSLATIKRVEPGTDTVTDMLTPGIYDVYTFSVNNADEITFSALRLSDGVKVIGLISPAGEVTIIDEISNFQYVIIEPI